MIKLDYYSFEKQNPHEVLPPEHALVRGQPINPAIYERRV